MYFGTMRPGNRGIAPPACFTRKPATYGLVFLRPRSPLQPFGCSREASSPQTVPFLCLVGRCAGISMLWGACLKRVPHRTLARVICAVWLCLRFRLASLTRSFFLLGPVMIFADSAPNSESLPGCGILSDVAQFCYVPSVRF